MISDNYSFSTTLNTHIYFRVWIHVIQCFVVFPPYYIEEKVNIHVQDVSTQSEVYESVT